MANSSPKPARSISLPTRLHPNSEKIEAQLNKLKTDWESPLSSRETPLGNEAIRSGLADLVQLYNSAKQLIQSPLTQQSLLQPSARKTVEEALDGSIALLDACGAARDLLLRMKENAQSLHSSLRRKAVGDSSVESDLNAYVSFRKSAKREIAKSLRALKTMQSSNVQAFTSLHGDHSLEIVITVMRELSVIAISIFRCLFVFLSVPMTKSKAYGWSLISKLVPVTTFGGSSEIKEHKIFNEVGSVDVSLISFQGQLRKSNSAKNIDVEVIKKRLKALDGCVDGLESGLDCLFRCLIQHRVSLLNLITP